MAAHIPFVNTARDCDILGEYYDDSQIIRCSCESIDNILRRLPRNTSLWLDPAIDAYHYRLIYNWPEDKPFPKWTDRQQELWNNLETLFSKYSNYEILADEKQWKRSNFNLLKQFVWEVLDKCCDYNPSWLTIPQLPLVSDAKRNKINMMLCEATGQWKEDRHFDGRLIFPLIFTNQRQLHSKPIRDKKLNIARESCKVARAKGLWLADTSLSDQNRNDRFPVRYSKLIEFHDSIEKSFSKDTVIVAGPYWGINLVLWAKKLCHYPAISLGTGYMYYISGGIKKTGNIRIAIPSIRRRAVVHGDLRIWLEKAIKKLAPTDPSYSEFEYLLEKLTLFSSRDIATKQVAKFYKQWFDEIDTIPESGRTLGLFQDLSSAYVLGKQLPKLPKSTIPNCPEVLRNAGKVAEQLMLKCL